MTGISQEVGNFSEQVWGVSMSVVSAELLCALDVVLQARYSVQSHGVDCETSRHDFDGGSVDDCNRDPAVPPLDDVAAGHRSVDGHRGC